MEQNVLSPSLTSAWPQTGAGSVVSGQPNSHQAKTYADRTREAIHHLTDFSVSQALGIPLLTQDFSPAGSVIGVRTLIDEKSQRARPDWSSWVRAPAPRIFPALSQPAGFSRLDFMAACAAALMTIGPLFAAFWGRG